MIKIIIIMCIHLLDFLGDKGSVSLLHISALSTHPPFVAQAMVHVIVHHVIVHRVYITSLHSLGTAKGDKCFATTVHLGCNYL